MKYLWIDWHSVSVTITSVSRGVTITADRYAAKHELILGIGVDPTLEERGLKTRPLNSFSPTYSMRTRHRVFPWGFQMKYNETDLPAYSDTAYSDTPHTVTRLACPKWLVCYLTSSAYSNNLVTVTLSTCPEGVTVSGEICNWTLRDSPECLYMLFGTVSAHFMVCLELKISSSNVLKKLSYLTQDLIVAVQQKNLTNLT